MSTKPSSKKSYHTIATGEALQTVKSHSSDAPLKLYGSCFCPFVQRVWIALEHKKLPYQYIEVDPYAKPPELLAINPRGLVPALKHGDWSCHESTVLMEYLEDAFSPTAPLLPSDPQRRAHARLWADHVNRHVVPSFYRLLQAQDVDKQAEFTAELRGHIAKLVRAADQREPFFEGAEPGFVDAQIAPWVVRLERVLVPYRAWEFKADEEGGGVEERWEAWVRGIEMWGAVKATTSGEELYLESYERYAENRPNTSQLAKAINEGRGLP